MPKPTELHNVVMLLIQAHDNVYYAKQYYEKVRLEFESENAKAAFAITIKNIRKQLDELEKVHENPNIQ